MEVASSDLSALALQNAKRSKALFGSQPAESARKRLRILDPVDAQFEKEAVALRLHAEYSDLRELPVALAQKQASAAGARGNGPRKAASGGAGAAAGNAPEDQKTQKLIEGILSRSAPNGSISSPSNALVRSTRQPPAPTPGITGGSGSSQALSTARSQAAHHVKPDWHPPWKLMRVISGHLGWVRALAVEPENQWFASGAGDRTIKIWDLATGNLRLTLTGHISTVRGLAATARIRTFCWPRARSRAQLRRMLVPVAPSRRIVADLCSGLIVIYSGYRCATSRCTLC